MLSLGTGFKEIPETGGFKELECKGFEVKILAVIDAKSKAGKDMIRFDMDITSGENAGAWDKYPKRIYQLYDTDENKGRLKSIFNVIIAQNLTMFPEGLDKIYDSGTFDEQRLVGLTSGIVTKWDNGYITPSYFTTKEKAEAQKTIPKPEQAAAVSATANAKGDFF